MKNFLAICLSVVLFGCGEKPKEKAELTTEGAWVKESDAKDEQGPSEIVFLNIDAQGAVYAERFPQAETDTKINVDETEVGNLVKVRTDFYQLVVNTNFQQNLVMAQKNRVPAQETSFLDFLTVQNGVVNVDTELKDDDLKNIYFEQTSENKAQLIRDHASREKHVIALVKVKSSKIVSE